MRLPSPRAAPRKLNLCSTGVLLAFAKLLKPQDLVFADPSCPSPAPSLDVALRTRRQLPTTSQGA